RTLGWPEPALARGLAAPAPPARFERFAVAGPRGPVAVVLDGAHDPAAAARVAAAMPRRYVLLFGALERKQAEATLAPLRHRAACVVATSADPEEPSAAVATDAATLPDPHEAIAHAVAIADALGAPVLVAGSLHLAGRVRPWLRAHALAAERDLASADAGAMLGGRWDASGSSA
ncbi:MAG: hypothetical protein P1P87_14745, partial [Trueperaceae bacterium]|nr:hypothetical protein [Trueperaceae bacterium]